MTAPTSSANSLSIAIVTYQSPPEQLESTAHSLALAINKAKEVVTDFNTTVYLINNEIGAFSKLASHEKFAEILNESNINNELISGHGNIGYGRGQNLALNRADTSYHLILNPDVNLSEHCLLEGINFLRENPQTIAVCPKVRNASGECQYLCKRFPSIYDLFLRGFAPGFIKKLNASRLERYEMRDVLSKPGRQEVSLISGCFILCRTRVLQNIGVFNERYFMYFEDYDLSIRMHKLGKIFYLPKMEITHFGGNSADKGLKHIAMFIRSGFKFYNTHGWHFI